MATYTLRMTVSALQARQQTPVAAASALVTQTPQSSTNVTQPIAHFDAINNFLRRRNCL